MDHKDIPEVEVDNENVDEFSDDDDDNSADEEMSTADDETTTCLFCENTFKSVDYAMEHLKKDHNLSFSHLKCKFHMDQYSFLKLINCIRCDGVSIEKLTNATKPFWEDEKYLKAKEYEPWLVYDYEQLPTEENEESHVNTEYNNREDQLRAIILSLQQKIKNQALMLEHAAEDMEKMRAGFQRMLEKEVPPNNTKTNGVSHTDDSYFSSYAHFGIHHEMLSDIVRTTSYRNALLHNKNFIMGKDVLDVGCGTSILSIFASQAGAKSVVGIDNSDIIYDAMDVIRKNNIENVTLVKGRLEDTELPQKKFDIIVSEWMGYFLLFEGMLDTIIYARDHHLTSGGIILPNRFTMSLLGYGSEELFKNHIAFWDDVYGLDMSTLRKKVMCEPLVEIVDANHILTEAEKLADFHLATVDVNYSNFTYKFNMKCTKDGKLSAFVGYFDTYFDLPVPIMFGTSPQDQATHWKQVIFFIEEPQVVKVNDVINGKFVCRRSRDNARSLDIKIEAFGRKYSYYLD